jgi:hypothetical protein
VGIKGIGDLRIRRIASKQVIDPLINRLGAHRRQLGLPAGNLAIGRHGAAPTLWDECRSDAYRGAPFDITASLLIAHARVGRPPLRR